MATTPLRIGIVGCGRAARIHLARLVAQAGVQVVGCADLDPDAAGTLAAGVPDGPAPAFADHRELLDRAAPQAVSIFTPHRAHYRPAMDALQAGCHVFIEKPLSTNSQEAVDIAGLARARGRKVGVGHQYRLRPSLIEARRRLASGAIGRLRLVTAVLAQPWLAAHSGPADAWRHDPKLSGGGILADAGDHLIDALLWTTGQAAEEVMAIQGRLETGLDLVTAAAVRLADGTPATLALSGDSAAPLFALTFFGQGGRLLATDSTLVHESGAAPAETVELPEPSETIDSNFVAAVRDDAPLCCPAEEALDTVRLLEAIIRSAAGGQAVRPS
jgi:predicted dehydrogenase